MGKTFRVAHLIFIKSVNPFLLRDPDPQPSCQRIENFIPSKLDRAQQPLRPPLVPRIPLKWTLFRVLSESPQLFSCASHGDFPALRSSATTTSSTFFKHENESVDMVSVVHSRELLVFLFFGGARRCFQQPRRSRFVFWHYSLFCVSDFPASPVLNSPFSFRL